MALLRSRAPARAGKAPVAAAPSLPPLPPFVQEQHVAYKRLLPPALWQQVMQPVLERLPAYCWALPAPDDDTPWSLLRQALEQAAQAGVLLSHSTLWWQREPDVAQRLRAQGQWCLGALLAEVCLDLGVLLEVHLTVGSARWEPLHGPLLPWLQQVGQAGTLPTPTITWAPPSPGAAALFARLLLQPDEWQVLSPPVARDLWGTLVGARGALLTQLLAPLRRPLRQTAPALQELAGLVLDALRQCCQDGTVPLNGFPGQLFLHPEATFLTVPHGLRPLRRALKAQGRWLPRDSQVFSSLAEAGYLLGPPGQQVTRLQVEPPGRLPVVLHVVGMPHAVLWGQQVPPVYPYPLTLLDAQTFFVKEAAL